jgi:hypothetical protein
MNTGKQSQSMDQTTVYVGEPYTHPAGRLWMAIQGTVFAARLATALFAAAIVAAYFNASMAGWLAGATAIALLALLGTTRDLAPLLLAVEDEPGGDPQRSERL